MKRVLWLIFGGLALLAAAVLFRSGPAGETAAGGEPAPSPSVLPDVRVRHEFIEIPIPPPPTAVARGGEPASTPPKKTLRRAPSAAPRSDAVRTADAGTRRTVELPDRGANLLVRAGRAIVGDGKYRPEPFPRIKKD